MVNVTIDVDIDMDIGGGLRYNGVVVIWLAVVVALRGLYRTGGEFQCGGLYDSKFHGT